MPRPSKYTPEERKARKTADQRRFRKTPKARAARLRYLYGITLEQYDVMLREQGGVCAVCLLAETLVDVRISRVRALAVDHCHRTKKVRGLLCAACNKGIGNLKDNPTTLRRAADYVEQSQ